MNCFAYLLLQSFFLQFGFCFSQYFLLDNCFFLTTIKMNCFAYLLLQTISHYRSTFCSIRNSSALCFTRIYFENIVFEILPSTSNGQGLKLSNSEFIFQLLHTASTLFGIHFRSPPEVFMLFAMRKTTNFFKKIAFLVCVYLYTYIYISESVASEVFATHTSHTSHITHIDTQTHQLLLMLI